MNSTLGSVVPLAMFGTESWEECFLEISIMPNQITRRNKVVFLTCPEIPLSILSDQPVEVVLLGGSVQGHRLHAHRLAVRLGLVLLERGAANLPGGHIAALDVVPGVKVVKK